MSHFFKPMVEDGRVYIQPRTELVNLDQFKYIIRNGWMIVGHTSDIEDIKAPSVLLAECKSEDGAAYLLDCILRRDPVDEGYFNQIESGEVKYTPKI